MPKLFSILTIGVLFLVINSGVTSLNLVSQVFAQTTDPQANPASGVTLVAIPPRLGEDLSLTAKPGDTIQEQIRVRNTSSQPVVIQSRTLDFVLDQDATTPIAVNESVDNRWSLASWMTVAPGRQVLAPNQTSVVSLVIEVPSDALPGGHYAMVVHQPGLEIVETETNEEALNESATGINQQVGTLVYLLVEGPINEQAFIRNLNFPQFSEFGPVPYSFTVENNSDVHVRPSLEVSITNLLGRVVSTTALETKNVFPLTSRDFAGSWEQIWGTGLYKATVTMGYGGQGQVATASTSFWLIPIKLIITIIVLILTIVAVIIIIRRHYLHRKRNQDQKIKDLEKQVKDLESQQSSHE